MRSCSHPEFVELIRDHDSQRRPEVYKEGQDAAMEAIQETRPKVFVADSFPCPLALPQAEAVSKGSKEPIQGNDRALVTIESITDARGQQRKAVVSSSETGSSSSEEGSKSNSDSEEESATKKAKGYRRLL